MMTVKELRESLGYGEGFAPWREIARWRRRFWISLAVNVFLAILLLHLWVKP
jgi:hypothetical protein